MRFLACSATGIRHFTIDWDLAENGRDLRFIHELALIGNLRSAVIGGLYAVEWPDYLSQQIGIEFREQERSESGWRALRENIKKVLR